MGTAILEGLLDATEVGSSSPISRFLVSTNSAASASRIQDKFPNEGSRLRIAQGHNKEFMEEADIILLGFKPHMAERILGETGVKEALAGKFVISVLGGKTPQVLEEYISQGCQIKTKQPYVVRAMPNMAARIRKSMTIIEKNPELPANLQDTLVWIFETVGEVKALETDVFDTGSMLVGSSMAILSVGLDGILDGSVMEGIRRSDALQMAAQSMLGMAELFRQGEDPAAFRESVSSPRGSTIHGIVTVETAGVRGTFAQAMLSGVKKLKS
jgi:pyrroline-5-carboxylate reductase